jgi:hypothetical protein
MMSPEGLPGVRRHVVKRIVLGVVVLIGSLIPLERVSAAAPDIAGTRCSAAGVVRVVNRVSYTCTVSGKKRVWRRGATSATTTTSTTTTTTTTSTTTTTVPRTTTTVRPSSDSLETIQVKGNKRCVRSGDDLELIGYFAVGNRGEPTVSLARIRGSENPRTGQVLAIAPHSVSDRLRTYKMPDPATLPYGESTVNLVAVMVTWGSFASDKIEIFRNMNLCTEFSTTGTTVPLSNRSSLVKTLSNYSFQAGWLPDTNTPGYQYGHFSRAQMGQSFVIDKPMNIESVVFTVAAFTTVSDIDTYRATPEPANHLMETYDYVAEVELELQVSVWRSKSSAPLLDDIDLNRDLDLLYRQSSIKTMVAQAPFEFTFDTPVAVTPGSHLVLIRLVPKSDLVKRRILTFWVAAYHSGNATRGGFDRNMDANCNYQRGADIYPNGKAYFGNFVENYVNWRDSHNRTFETTLREMRGKVSACVTTGAYNDIFNEGDLIMELRGTLR